LETIFDSSELITCCRFSARGRLIIDHIVDVCDVIIPPQVQYEVAGPVPLSKYADAVEAFQRIKSGKIFVRSASPAVNPVLNLYTGLSEGEKEAITLTQQTPNAILVLDDRLGYVISDRLGIKKYLLMDFLVHLVDGKFLVKPIALEIVDAIESRYAQGFAEHTRLMLS
jgi:predicted nucleic acid-binding protein